jgi:GrpB-like predicted nucleotidyltransferase (UPF0157 family)
MTAPLEPTTHLRKVELVPPDPNWAAAYARAAQEWRYIFGANVMDMQHVGSTSIPGIKAKPVIDVLIEVQDLNAVDASNEAMQQIGYMPRGEYGVAGRRFFTKDNAGQRTHNVHSFQTGNPEIEAMLMFRDYLRSHPAAAQAYETLKLELAQKFPMNVNAYAAAKSEFVARILTARRVELAKVSK